MNSIWEKKISHGDILKNVWKQLDLAVIDRKHPFHTPVFATEAKGEANPRVVVLRRFWRKPAALAFHTHLAAPKIDEIRANPQVSWLFYSFEKKLQLRIRAIAEIHTNDELFQEQWNATHPFSRRCYMGEAPTLVSKTATSGMPEHIIDREPTPEESEIGEKNFAVVSTKIVSIDCLELDFLGNRRSLFTWSENGDFEMKWLTP
jgi:pyridoxamine 5'-phosphate oxidase